MHAFVVELDEDRVCLVDPEFVVSVAGFPGVEDEDHAGIEGLLAHGPADEHGLLAPVEEHEGLEDGNGRVDDEWAAALWRSRCWSLFR